jgi:hypothetical protein
VSVGQIRIKRLARTACSAAALGGALVAVSGAVAEAATLPALSISIAGGSITVAGAPVSGAVEVVTSTANAVKEPAPVLVLLNAGVTVEEFVAFLARNRTVDPNTVSRYGTLVFDGAGRPGSTTEAQTMLAPGTYVALNAEGEKSSKWSHASFAVAASPAPVALPTPGTVEKTIDFAFRGPATLRRGELVRFENEGFLVHMDQALPTRGRRTAERLARNLRLGHEKAAEKLVAGPPISFAGPLSTGALQQETITAAPGFYVQVCFMETQDGRSHALLGMERVIRVIS